MSQLSHVARRAILMTLLSVGLAAGAAFGCGDDDDGGEGTDPDPSGEQEEARHGLTAEQAGQTLVKVGDTTITVGEFADRLAEQSPYLRARYNSPERRREFLDNLVRFELLAIEAERRGHMDDAEVVRSTKQVMIQQMMKEEFEDQIQLSDISDEDIEAYYQEHLDEFQKPEQVRASHILIKNRAAAQRVLAQILERVSDVSFFRSMAEQHNEDPGTRDRYGDLRFFSRPEDAEDDEPAIPNPVRTAAFSIEQIGGVYPELVETPQGFHIVKLTGRRAALNRTLEEARRPIQNRLWRERREQRVEEFITRLRQEADIQESFENLEHVHVEAPPGSGSPAAGTPTPTPERPVPGAPQ